MAGSGALTDTIQLDLVAARQDLATARLVQQLGDTPAARQQVAACLAELDRLLDMWNDARPTGG
ncbi:hypothetical protein [Modestobacter sp. NPDC049651]|uniref:hypothetical protein n=1 Tax=unclassified Modestobacter TaxID=2643866 RepID=UPI0033F2C712